MISARIYFITERLFAANYHSRKFQGRGRRSISELEIVADHFYVHQHIFQVTGDGDFLHRECQCAIFDPETSGTEREISVYGVYAKSKNIREIKYVFN